MTTDFANLPADITPSVFFAAIAEALKDEPAPANAAPDKLLLLVDAPGLEENGELVSEIRAADLRARASVPAAVGAAVGVGGGARVAVGNWVAVAVGEAWVGTAVGGWFSLDAETGLQATMPETAKKANSASKKRSGGGGGYAEKPTQPATF